MFVTSAFLVGTGAANATSFLDFSTDLSGWTVKGDVTATTSTVAFTIGGKPFSLTPAAGYSMVRIAANGGVMSPNATLGLSDNSLEDFLNNSDGSITNFGLMTKSYDFNVGTYSFAWAYAAEDYQPFNDGAVFTLAGGGTQSLYSLARNGSNPSDLSGPSPYTQILGSYGSTAWLATTFEITTAGTYQVGFGAYNWDDTSLSPNLFVSAIAGTFTGDAVETSGPPLPPPPPTAPPVIGGTGGNVSDDTFDPSSPAYSQSTLTFEGGTLQYTSDTTTSKDAVLNSEGGTLDTNGTNVNYTGEISGTGVLTKSGEGTLVLTNGNTYTGTTEISGGTLALTGTGNISASAGVVNNGSFDISGTTDGTSVTTLSGTGSVELGSKTLTLSNAADTFSGVINGTGGVEVVGGTLALTGTNTFSGGVKVSNGATLVATDGAALGDGAGTLTLNDGAFVNAGSFSVSQNVALAGSGLFSTAADSALTATGSISGAGNLVKTGAGTLVLAGDNSALDSSTSVVIDDGVLELANANGVGSANVVLNSGTLSTLNSTTIHGNVALGGNTSVVTADSSTLTINAPITSVGGTSGCFVKDGAGTLVMAGAASISEGTCVKGGKLYANGLLNSTVTVETGGTLRGTGVVSGPITVHGTLAPGNSPGILQVAAPITMMEGSVYQEDINGLGTGFGPGSYSRLIISGAENQFVASGATLAPNLVNITGSDTYVPYVPAVGDAFRIITAEGGIVGEFASVTQPEGLAPATRMEVFYNVENSNSVDLFVVPTSYSGYTQAHSGNRNAVAVADVLDTLVDAKATDVATVDQEALLYAVSAHSDATLTATATALAGEVHGALAAAAPMANRWLADSVGRELARDVALGDLEDGRGVWVDVGANRSDWHGDDVASGFDTSRSQVAIGWNLIGGAGDSRLGVGFTHGKSDVSAALGSGSVTHNLGFVYGQMAFNRIVVDGLAAADSSNWETDRPDPIAPFSVLATEVDGHDVVVAAGVRLPLNTKRVALSPYARATWERLSRDGFNEDLGSSGSQSSLSSGSYSASGTRLTAGLQGGSLDQGTATRPATFAWHFNAGVGRDSSDLLQPEFDVSLAGVNTSLTTPDVGRTFVFGELNATARISGRLYGYFGVTGEARSGKSEDLGANVGVRMTF